ncbi:hypothetical protein F5X99DRAFT_424487 [Biscogniauxia marginata]|nr:hypothetical protein F5X99DRAFT_424487 [Biscogniauxia marginata]
MVVRLYPTEDIDIVGDQLRNDYNDDLRQFQEAFDPRNVDNENDDPPPPNSLANIPKVLTWGATLEVCVATSRGMDVKSDPHPAETRWLSRYFSEKEFAQGGLIYKDMKDTREWILGTRYRILETLRLRGIHTGNTPDSSLYAGHNPNNEPFDPEVLGFHEGYENMSLYRLFVHPVNGYGTDWNPNISEQDNVDIATTGIRAHFLQYADANGLHPSWVLGTTIHFVAEQFRQPTFLRGGWPQGAADEVCRQCKYLMLEDIVRYGFILQGYEDIDANPTYVRVPGMKRRDMFVTCGRNHNMNMSSVQNVDYQRADEEDILPRRYRWFLAKIRTPVLDTTDASYNMIQSVCHNLRREYRIHKPMSVLSGGTHIHLGSTHGWTLKQLKRFVSLWVLVEWHFCRLFRSERCTAWQNLPIATHSRIGRYTREYRRDLVTPGYTYNEEMMRDLEWYRVRHWNETRRIQSHHNIHIDFYHESHLQEFMDEIWQYPSINMLREGLADGYQYEEGQSRDGMAIDLDVNGYKRTGDRPPGSNRMNRTQTVIVRILQSTLDTQHINSWAKVLNAMVEFVHTAPDWEFAERTARIWVAPRRPDTNASRTMGFFRTFAREFNVPDAIAYLVGKDHPYGIMGYYVYPDNDKVDWEEPFMTVGRDSMYDWQS